MTKEQLLKKTKERLCDNFGISSDTIITDGMKYENIIKT